MKYSLEGLNCIVELAEVRISRFEDVSYNPKNRKKKMKQNKVSEMWETIKQANICVMGVSERKERKEQKQYSKKQ